MDIHEDDNVVVNLPHHVQQGLCTTRAPYRQGRKLTAVKVVGNQVYTVSNESQHLLIYRVPAINLSNELQALCDRWGEVTKLCKLELIDPGEEFTEIYHVRYNKIRQARFAKRQLDGRSFYGNVLHVCYAPELESIEETKLKLINRRNEIAFHTGRKVKIPNITPRSTTGFKRSSNQQSIPNKRFKIDNQSFTSSSLTSSAKHAISLNSVTGAAMVYTAPPCLVSRGQPATASCNGSDSQGNELPPTDVLGPYDRAVSYPSQEILELPGAESKAALQRNFIPSTVIKKNPTKHVLPNKIIFHNK